jgi:hypothetical protein
MGEGGAGEASGVRAQTEVVRSSVTGPDVRRPTPDGVESGV